jgi:methionyl-tRNA formyltransferase
MRLVFFGSPEAALPSLEALRDAVHAIALVVTQPDRPSGRGKVITAGAVKRFALDHKIPVIQPESIRKDPAALEAIRNAAADIHVVVAFGQIIPASIFDLPKHKSINVHFSLLPKYRGAAPVSRALLEGEAKTGVTIFRLNEKMDEGDILATAATDIFPAENAGELETRLAGIGARLLSATLARIDDITPVPQNHALATYAPKIQKEDGRIDWRAHAAAVARKVRAFTPRPGAFTMFKGQRVIIIEGGEAGRGGDERPHGTILAVNKSGLEVACGENSAFRIARLRPESRSPMEAYAYSLSGRMKALDVFG